MITTTPKPDFLCIGAQKSGTTWLYENLAKHPEVWAPPIKEFHYFNRVCINEKLLGEWDLPHPGDSFRRYKEALLPPHPQNLRWLRRFYEYGLSKRRYLSLFDSRFTQGKICGDITPEYSTLEERGVKYAHAVIGEDTPIIFIVRNPIHRSWSAAKMLLRYRQQSALDMPREELIALLSSADITLCSEYSRIIPLWRKYFKNFHLLNYDMLATDPKGFLAEISCILGIKNTWDEATITKEVWSDKQKIGLPNDIFELLAKQYRQDIEYLCDKENSKHAQQWLKGLDDRAA